MIDWKLVNAFIAACESIVSKADWSRMHEMALGVTDEATQSLCIEHLYLYIQK